MSLLVAVWLISFALAMLWAPSLIRALRVLKFGKQIRREGPSSHQVKAGTPTMGGWLFILTPLVVAFVLLPDRATAAVPLVAMLVFGAAGALDDYVNLKSKEGLGFKVRYKLLWHGLLALALAAWLSRSGQLQLQRLPGGSAIDLGWFFIPFAALVIFACTASVNEVDGLDGLAGGTSLIALGCYLGLASAAGLDTVAGVAAAVGGAVLAFLWHNVHPAKVFMGDTGALALGAGLAVIALQTRWALLLPIVGVVFVVDTASVILQIAYFKLTRGRRLFRMTPIHHGLELGGWPETLVVQRFWIIGILGGALGVALGR